VTAAHMPWEKTQEIPISCALLEGLSPETHATTRRPLLLGKSKGYISGVLRLYSAKACQNRCGPILHDSAVSQPLSETA